MRPNLRSIVHRRIHRETSAIVWAASSHFECPLSHNTIMAEQNTYQVHSLTLSKNCKKMSWAVLSTSKVQRTYYVS